MWCTLNTHSHTHTHKKHQIFVEYWTMKWDGACECTRWAEAAYRPIKHTIEWIYVFCIKIDLPNHNATMCPNVFQYSQYNLNSFWKTSAVEAHATHTHTHTEHGAKTLTRAPLIYTVREKIALEKNRKMVGNRKYSEVKFHTNNGRMRWQQQPHQFVKYKFMLKMVVVRYIYYENCKRERVSNIYCR